MKQTSLLLGAGFSVNQGYPTTNQLNAKLTDLHPDNFWIHTSGTVFFKEKTRKIRVGIPAMQRGSSSLSN